MSSLLHMRGDVGGMLAFFMVFFLGCWQVVVAAYRLNGLSLTGYPVRRGPGFALGTTLAAGSVAFYFSRPGHFAAPDVEGMETLAVMIFGLVAATVVQGALASLARAALRRRGERTPGGEEIELELEGVGAPACYYPGRREAPSAVLLLHDYGGHRSDVAGLARGLAERGYACLAVQLDGHDSPREISDPCMAYLLRGALEELAGRSGAGAVVVVGIGLGGTLACALARGGAAAAAVALDPPALDEDGRPMVNALGELSPATVLSAFLRPPARASGGARLSQAALLRSLPRPGPGPGRVSIIGSRERWLNTPGALEEYAERLGAAYETVGCSHAGMAAAGEALEALHRALVESVPV